MELKLDTAIGELGERGVHVTSRDRPIEGEHCGSRRMLFARRLRVGQRNSSGAQKNDENRFAKVPHVLASLEMFASRCHSGAAGRLLGQSTGAARVPTRSLTVPHRECCGHRGNRVGILEHF